MIVTGVVIFQWMDNLNLKATTQVAKRNELHRFEVLPQRWVIERSFSWV